MVSKLFCGGLMALALSLVSCGQDQIVDTSDLFGRTDRTSQRRSGLDLY